MLVVDYIDTTILSHLDFPLLYHVAEDLCSALVFTGFLGEALKLLLELLNMPHLLLDAGRLLLEVLALLRQLVLLLLDFAFVFHALDFLQLF